ncbi:MAG: thermonuclease family protein [Proteobacteria bacterium]|nr:thermonuclease family protein [Pseudomonadota bacterium]
MVSLSRLESDCAPRAGFIAVAAAFALGLVVGVAVSGIARPGAASGAATGAPDIGAAAPTTDRLVASGHPAEVLRVLDGDTFEARVKVWPGLDITTKVRLRGIDAPEMNARCASERVKADAARAALVLMLAEGAVAVTRVGLDKYGGRVLADAATRATPNVSRAMLAGGHARAYAGGRRESWCGGER